MKKIAPMSGGFWTTSAGLVRGAMVGMWLVWAAAGARAADAAVDDASARSTNDSSREGRADPTDGGDKSGVGAESGSADAGRRAGLSSDGRTKSNLDPLQDYLARWMAPDDFELLVKGRRPGTGPDRAGQSSQDKLAFPALEGFAVDANGVATPGVQLDPANNPYLRAMQGDAPRPAVDAPKTEQQTPKASPKLEAPPPPDPKKAKGPEFGNPLKEKREFPQLKGF